MKELIQTLCQTFGPSGYEEKVAEVIKGLLKGKVDEIRTDALGNLIAVKKGNGKKIMLAAHMDEIGVIISYIDDKGFLRFGNVGGVYAHVALGQRVVFESGLVGVVWYEENLDSMKDLKLDKMFIDIGTTSREETEKLVKVGDLAVFTAPTVEQNGIIISKALDDRIGCAVLVQTALNAPETDNEIYYVFTAQEEVGLRGARTAAYGILPDMALAVDVTDMGDIPNCKPMAVKMGHGPTIKIKDSSVMCHPEVIKKLTEAAQKEGIPYQNEVLLAGGTDAGSIHITAGGIPSGGVSLATRYIHDTAEMIALKDVENAVRLLEAFVK